MDLSLPGEAKPGFGRRRIPCNTLRIEIVVSTQPGGAQIHLQPVFREGSGLGTSFGVVRKVGSVDSSGLVPCKSLPVELLVNFLL